jgi:hypothetical protein
VRALAALVVALACAACSTAAAEPAGPTPLQRELSGLVAQMEAVHPDLYHSVTRARLRAEVDELVRRAPTLTRPQLVVGLMRVVGLLGPRDGHSGVYPIDPHHPRSLHAYPLKLYVFPDGLYVIDAADRSLIGARLASVEGVAADELVDRIEPLMTRDNASTIRMRLPGFVVSEEVLAGLGIGDGGPARFGFADGRSATLEPQTVAAHVSRFRFEWQVLRPSGPQPLWLQRQGEPQSLRLIDRGRAVYLGYHQVTGGVYFVAQRLEKLARRPQVRRVVVDVRMNGGGDNTTYGPLLGVLEQPAVGRKAVVLTGRVTFSAAANFVAEVAARTRARLIGEPTGGAPNQWGDNTIVELPVAGVALRLANQYVQVTRAGDERTTIVPDVRVDLTAADFFAGRAPVLARALRH